MLWVLESTRTNTRREKKWNGSLLVSNPDINRYPSILDVEKPISNLFLQNSVRIKNQQVVFTSNKCLMLMNKFLEK